MDKRLQSRERKKPVERKGISEKTKKKKNPGITRKDWGDIAGGGPRGCIKPWSEWAANPKKQIAWKREKPEERGQTLHHQPKGSKEGGGL